MIAANTAAVVVYGGPGGVCEGLRLAGVEHRVSVEWDETAVSTATKAGHHSILANALTFRPSSLSSWFLATGMQYLLLQLSPPCQGISKAGKGTGKQDFERLMYAIEQVERNAASAQLWSNWLVQECADDKSPLIFEVFRWVIGLNPHFIMLEQVPGALVLWEAIAVKLRLWSYDVWTGNVQAEQFGVPQTRKRAKLLGSRVSEVAAPVPTHSKFHSRSPERLDEGVLPWVSMAEALQWGMTERPYPTIAPSTGQGGPDSLALGGSGARKVVYREHDEGRWVPKPGFEVVPVGDDGLDYAPHEETFEKPFDANPADIEFVSRRDSAAWVAEHGERRNRTADQPSPTVTGESWRWGWRLGGLHRVGEYPHLVMDEDKLAEIVGDRMNNQSGTEFDHTWPAKRPATVIAGRDLVTNPGANANRFNGATKSRNDGIRVTVQEAGVLQSFRPNYPWQGSKTKRHEQVGNAVPPLLQCALTLHLLECASVSTLDNEAA